MPRIRTIKPEFWSDEKLSMLSPIDRLTFLGLISMADDYGRLPHNIKVIDAFIFPNSDDSVRESLANLSRMGRVLFGKASNGMAVLQIVNWEKHQKVDKPQPKLALPPIDPKTTENAGEIAIRESVANQSRTDRELVAPHTPIPIRDRGAPTNDHDQRERDASEEFEKVWTRWKLHSLDKGKMVSGISEETQLMQLAQAYPDEADRIAAIEFSILKNWANINLGGDHRRPPTETKPQGRRQKTTFEEVGL